MNVWWWIPIGIGALIVSALAAIGAYLLCVLNDYRPRF